MRFVLLVALAPATLVAQAPADTGRVRSDSAHRLEGVTVSAIRARDGAPISAATVTRATIERRNFGQDIPLLLQGTPSLTAYSEAGNHWGYSYLRLRGIDQQRINLTLDGIPLNDPEDQVLYFADFPDLANSVESVQIQRGVAASAIGTASYGGAINFETIPVAATPRGGELQLQGGSFGSGRVSGEYASGLLRNGAAVYGRVSALQSAGYRRHSGMEGRSAFLSAAHVGARHLVKLTALAGLFADTLAYLGATRAELAADRRFNPLRPDEVDRFGEQLVALSYTRALGAGASAAATAYRISASGAYDVCISACDQPVGELWQFNLDFAWYGATVAWTLDRGATRTSIGANANTYARDHHAYARPDLASPLYFNTGHKDDASLFGKIAHELGRATLHADVAARWARFGYAPDANAGIAPAAIEWRFVNPKIGATVRLTPSLDAYASFGITSREPARSDLFGGFDNLDTTNVGFVGPFTRVRPERSHNVESGVRLRGAHWGLDVNGFAMEFRDEILPVGRLSYIGTPLRTNVGGSWRRGLETQLALQPLPRARIELAATAMRARIAQFTDDETGTTYRNVAPLLTPSLLASHVVTVDLGAGATVSVSGRYVGRSQLDNTGAADLVLPAYYVADVVANVRLPAATVALHVSNVANSRRFAGGHLGYGEARFYVLPPVNAQLKLTLGL